jgi:hypothetical protein
MLDAIEIRPSLSHTDVDLKEYSSYVNKTGMETAYYPTQINQT